MMGDLLRILNEQKKSIEDSPISNDQLAQLIINIDKGTISGKIAKTVFENIANGQYKESNVDEIIAKHGLAQVSDTKAIDAVIEKIMAANMEQVQQYRSGKEKVFGFFVGQVMKEMKGQGNPQTVNDILKKKLKGE
jgi:aspartyl-tRNA(Asn)/glutamyl-tRNA(Gln) amidotransferase subunit B